MLRTCFDLLQQTCKKTKHINIFGNISIYNNKITFTFQMLLGNRYLLKLNESWKNKWQLPLQIWILYLCMYIYVNRKQTQCTISTRVFQIILEQPDSPKVSFHLCISIQHILSKQTKPFHTFFNIIPSPINIEYATIT